MEIDIRFKYETYRGNEFLNSTTVVYKERILLDIMHNHIPLNLIINNL